VGGGGGGGWGAPVTGAPTERTLLGRKCRGEEKARGRVPTFFQTSGPVLGRFFFRGRQAPKAKKRGRGSRGGGKGGAAEKGGGKTKGHHTTPRHPRTRSQGPHQRLRFCPGTPPKLGRKTGGFLQTEKPPGGQGLTAALMGGIGGGRNEARPGENIFPIATTAGGPPQSKHQILRGSSR